jgi:adenylosuccinate synthase
VTHVIVTGLGFGDEGKGSVTDWLCSPRGTALRGERPVAAVVRHNGGAQAGHNVIHVMREHVFAQFGSGTLHGVPTFLSRYMMLDPLALAAEAAHLAAIGVPAPLDLIAVDREALITTPYHAAANQARENARGAGRHGSCGVGIGETARCALEHPDAAVRAGDCAGPAWELRRKLTWARLLLAEDAGPLGGVPSAADLTEAYAAFAARIRLVDGSPHLSQLLQQGPVIFEGAQGVLLDEWRGWHPYTTWSTTTSANAQTLLAEQDEQGYVLGVTRSYMTRHGAGPFVTEDPALDFAEPRNTAGQWQGAFRLGHPDALALDYAVQASGGIDGLAVTHLDADVSRLRLCTAYTGLYGTRITRLHPGPPRNLPWQEGFTRVLSGSKPVYEDEPASSPDVLAHDLARVAQAPLVLRSCGPGPDRKLAASEALA